MRSGGQRQGRRLLVLTALLYGALFWIQAVSAPDPAARAKADERRLLARAEWTQKEKLLAERAANDAALMKVVSFALLAAMYWGTFFNVYFGRRWLRGEPWPLEKVASAIPRWDEDAAWGAVAILLLLELVLYGGFTLLRSAAGWSAQKIELASLVAGLIRSALLVVYVIHIVRSRYSQGLSELGLSAVRWTRQIGYAVLGYLAMVPPLILTLVLVMGAMQLLGAEARPQPVVEMLIREDSSAPVLTILMILVAVVGPVFEEVFFRGFLYAGFRNRYGALAGGLMSSAIFAALHLHGPAFFPILLLGLFLAYLYEVSGTLVAPAAAHALHNTIAVLMMMGFRLYAG